MPAKSENTLYCPMGNLCTEFEPFSGTTPFPGYHGLHCHDFYEFYVFFSGAPYHSMGGRISPLYPCTLVIIPPFHMHGLVGSQNDTPYERAWLYLTPSTIQKATGGTPDLNGYFKKCVQSDQAYFTICQEEANRLRTIIEDIQAHLSDKSEIEKWKNRLRVSQFLADVYDLTQTSATCYHPVVLNETIHAVLSYINEHYREPLSIQELSRQFGISASYMAREFSVYTGRSVYDYILYRRILCAKEMIYAGSPFTKVAFECGFNDYSCFLRAFKNLSGQSPSAYKKYIRSIESISESPRC